MKTLSLIILYLMSNPRLNQTNGFESEGAGAYMKYVRKAESQKICLDHLKMGLGIMRFILVLVLSGCLSGCQYQKPAPINYNNNDSYQSQEYPKGKTHYSEKTIAKVDDIDEHINEHPLETHLDERPIPSPVPHSKQATTQEMSEIKKANEKVNTIYHEVSKGDTIDTIANKYKQNPERIVRLNQLREPYALEENQMLAIEVDNEVLNAINNSAHEDPSTVELAKKSQNGKSEFIYPVIGGKVVSEFGAILNGSRNRGLKISSDVGSDVLSICEGVVAYSGVDNKFGNLVIIKKANEELYIAYAHLQDLVVSKNQHVKQGEVIGHIGITGDVQSPVLYLAIKKGTETVDPMLYLP